ncbi:IS630 family transposase, partial [Streptomyces sp. KR55]
IKRKLKKIQYRPHLIDGCLPPTGLIMDDDATRSSDSTSST